VRTSLLGETTREQKNRSCEWSSHSRVSPFSSKT
jgi:hypothetical protein